MVCDHHIEGAGILSESGMHFERPVPNPLRPLSPITIKGLPR